jgi:hypothetical protein
MAGAGVVVGHLVDKGHARPGSDSRRSSMRTAGLRAYRPPLLCSPLCSPLRRNGLERPDTPVSANPLIRNGSKRLHALKKAQESLQPTARCVPTAAFVPHRREAPRSSNGPERFHGTTSTRMQPNPASTWPSSACSRARVSRGKVQTRKRSKRQFRLYSHT